VATVGFGSIEQYPVHVRQVDFTNKPANAPVKQGLVKVERELVSEALDMLKPNKWRREYEKIVSEGTQDTA
jgi:hypothetical protein